MSAESLVVFKEYEMSQQSERREPKTYIHIVLCSVKTHV